MSDLLQPAAGESLDRLSLVRRVLQRRAGHRSATDDVLAAWSAWSAAPGAQTFLDLGCGHASVSLYLTSVLPESRGVAVEAQEVSAALARRNVLLNELQDRVWVHRADLRELDGEVLRRLGAPARFDLITGTPPFMPVGSGLLSRDPQRAAARFELRGGIEDYCACAARLLAPEGVVSMLMDGAQDERSRAAVAAAGLHLRARLVVLPRQDRAARFIAYIAAQAPSGAVQERTLTIRNAAGQHTGPYRDLRRALRIDP